MSSKIAVSILLVLSITVAYRGNERIECRHLSAKEND